MVYRTKNIKTCEKVESNGMIIEIRDLHHNLYGRMPEVKRAKSSERNLEMARN